jgi:hypothetical protein
MQKSFHQSLLKSVLATHVKKQKTRVFNFSFFLWKLMFLNPSSYAFLLITTTTTTSNITTQRNTTQNFTSRLYLSFKVCEYKNHLFCLGMQNALIEGASSKVPKVAAASIAVITEALKYIHSSSLFESSNNEQTLTMTM